MGERSRKIVRTCGLRARDAQACSPGVGGLDAGSDRGGLHPGLRKAVRYRCEGRIIGGFEREPCQPRTVLVARARAGAMPDVAGDVMMIAPRRHEARAVAAAGHL